MGTGIHTFHIGKQEKESQITFGVAQRLDLKETPKIQSRLLLNLRDASEKSNIPVISLLFSIGFIFWLVLFLITYLIYKKRYMYIIVFAPFLFLWLTLLASPVAGEFRYAYSMFICFPIYIGTILVKDEQN